MSISLMTLAWKTPLSCGRKMVLLALCDNANDQGECYPSIATLADKCGMGERTVQQHITDLENDGMVRRAMRSGRSTVYHINLRKSYSGADYAPEQNSHPTTPNFAPSAPQALHPPPLDFAPITVKEPSIEPSPKSGSSAMKRKTALPADWKLSKKMGEWALTEFPYWSAEDVRRTADKFHDHWLSVGGVKKDWEATWRNWCRNESRAWAALPRAAPARGFESEKDKARRAVAAAISGNGAGIYGRIIDIGSGTADGAHSMG